MQEGQRVYMWSGQTHWSHFWHLCLTFRSACHRQRLGDFLRDALAAWPDVPCSELAHLLCYVFAAWPDIRGSELACLLCDVLAAWPNITGSELARLLRDVLAAWPELGWSSLLRTGMSLALCAGSLTWYSWLRTGLSLKVLCDVLVAWPEVPRSGLACLTLLALGICRLWRLSDSSSVLLTESLIKWRKACFMFVCMRRRFICVSINLFLMHWMKVLHASFFARESASNLMAQTQHAATVAISRTFALQTLPWAIMSFPSLSLRIMGPHGPMPLSHV